MPNRINCSLLMVLLALSATWTGCANEVADSGTTARASRDGSAKAYICDSETRAPFALSALQDAVGAEQRYWVGTGVPDLAEVTRDQIVYMARHFFGEFLPDSELTLFDALRVFSAGVNLAEIEIGGLEYDYVTGFVGEETYGLVFVDHDLEVVAALDDGRLDGCALAPPMPEPEPLPEPMAEPMPEPMPEPVPEPELVCDESIAALESLTDLTDAETIERVHYDATTRDITPDEQATARIIETVAFLKGYEGADVWEAVDLMAHGQLVIERLRVASGAIYQAVYGSHRDEAVETMIYEDAGEHPVMFFDDGAILGCAIR